MSTTYNSELEESVSVELIENNTIGVITIRGVSRSTIDQWFDATAKLLTEWPTDRIFKVLHDASDRRITVTPYWRARINDLYKLKLNKKSYAAIILPKSVTTQVIQVFLRYIRTDPMVVQIFFSKDEAVAWLKRSGVRG